MSQAIISQSSSDLSKRDSLEIILIYISFLDISQMVSVVQQYLYIYNVGCYWVLVLSINLLYFRRPQRVLSGSSPRYFFILCHTAQASKIPVSSVQVAQKAKRYSLLKSFRFLLFQVTYDLSRALEIAPACTKFKVLKAESYLKLKKFQDAQECVK